MKKFWIIGVVGFLFILFIVVTGLKWHKQKIAGQNTAIALRSASEAISNARLRHAFVYASSLFNESEELYQKAMQLWRKENERWYFVRDYDQVILMADNAEKKVNLAIKKAGEHRDRYQKDFEKLAEQLSAKIKDFESYYSFLPLPEDIRNKFVKGRILFTESQRSGDKGEFSKAYNKAKDASDLISQAYDFGKKKLNNYFRSFKDWEKLNKEALQLSHSRRVIMVDKIARKCYVYKNGKATHAFNSELGRNWIGDKNKEGDKSTPEGKYYITKKLKGSQTIYYKALLINYPNEEDKTRFNNNKANGVIPKTARIGGLIEIHGGGGKGTDWTDGCVALTDKDMDKIYPLADVGTPVFIVGSLISWDQLKTRETLKASNDDE